MQRACRIVVRRRRIALLLGLGLLMGGCRGCDNASLRFVPSDAQVVLTTPRLSRGVDQLRELLDGLREAGLSPAHPVARTLGIAHDTAREFGVSERYGIDGAQAAAVALLPNADVVLVVGVSHPARIAAWWRRLSEGILVGPVTTQGAKRRGLQIHSMRVAGDAGRWAALAWTRVDQMSLAVLASNRETGGRSPGARAAASVVRFAKLESHASMAQSGALRRSLADISGRAALAGFVDVRALWDRRGTRIRAASADASPELRGVLAGRHDMVGGLLAGVDGLGLALQTSATGVALRLRFLGGAGLADRATVDSSRAFEGEAAKLHRFLDPSSVVLGRASVDVDALLAAIVKGLPIGLRRTVYAQMGQVKRHHGIDVERALGGLSEHFALGLAAGAHQGPNPNGQGGNGPVDAEFVAVAQIRDASAADALLVNLERALVLRGVEVRVHDPDTDTDASPSYAAWGQGSCAVARWGRAADVLVLRLAAWGCLAKRGVAGPSAAPGHLDALEAIRMPRARKSFGRASGAVIYIDAARAIRAMGGRIRNVPALGAVGWPLALLANDLAVTIDADGRDLLSEVVLRLGTEQVEQLPPR